MSRFHVVLFDCAFPVARQLRGKRPQKSTIAAASDGAVLHVAGAV